MRRKCEGGNAGCVKQNGQKMRFQELLEEGKSGGLVHGKVVLKVAKNRRRWKVLGREVLVRRLGWRCWHGRDAESNLEEL